MLRHGTYCVNCCWTLRVRRISRFRLAEFLSKKYLADGRVDDAYVASIRFQFEFYPDDSEWKLLRAKILLLHDEPTLAALELADLQGVQVQLLLSIARLREGATSPELTMVEMTQLKEETQGDTQLERLRLGISAEASRLAGDLEGRVRALESLLSHGETSLGVLGTVSIATLLKAYGLLANEVANRQHLLVGDTASWLRFARSVARSPWFPGRFMRTSHRPLRW
ncbi:MAG: hypothetical protein CM1200mP41_04900 [Gammaproteobacteria bacterium]|nr:MAG: hypothetical protein CM1200mP41_04900 [Gammaproteobacteria bacterium]